MISEQRIDEALRYLLLPGDERVKLAKEEAQRKGKPIPAYLDDEVMGELWKRDFTQLRKVGGNADVPIGASVATDGRGHVAVVEVTYKGRARVNWVSPIETVQ